MKNIMWGQLTKTIDKNIEVEPSSNIKKYNVEYIINKILDYILLF